MSGFFRSTFHHFSFNCFKHLISNAHFLAGRTLPRPIVMMNGSLLSVHDAIILIWFWFDSIRLWFNLILHVRFTNWFDLEIRLFIHLSQMISSDYLHFCWKSFSINMLKMYMRLRLRNHTHAERHARIEIVAKIEDTLWVWFVFNAFAKDMV